MKQFILHCSTKQTASYISPASQNFWSMQRSPGFPYLLVSVLSTQRFLKMDITSRLVHMRKSIHLIFDLPNLMCDSLIIRREMHITLNKTECLSSAYRAACSQSHMMLRAACDVFSTARPRIKASSIASHTLHEHEGMIKKRRLTLCSELV